MNGTVTPDPSNPEQPSTIEPTPGDGPAASWMARLLRPAPLVAAGTALSFTAWAVGNLLKDEAIDFSSTPGWGTIVYLGWMAAAIGAAHIGFSIVRPRPAPQTRPSIHLVRALHVGLLVTASVGTGYVAWLWYRDGLDVIGLIADNQANLLRYAIPYSPGPATLRYAAIPAAALAIRNVFVFRWQRNSSRLRSVDVLSLIALAIVAVPSSRLSVLMALVTAAAVVCYYDRRAPSGRRVLIVIVLTAVALAGLNYSRNGGYYRERDVSDPASMLLYQSVSYLGAAFEGGSVTGDVLLGRTTASPVLGLDRVIDPFVPSFLPGHDSEPSDTISIHEISTIDRSLTTNSMFATTTLGFGIAPMLASLLGIFAGAVIVGFLLRRGTLASVLAAGPLLYAFAEVWRLNLFNDGLVIACIASPLLLHALITWWDQRWSMSARHASDAGTPPTRTSAPAPDEPTTIPDR